MVRRRRHRCVLDTGLGRRRQLLLAQLGASSSSLCCVCTGLWRAKWDEGDDPRAQETVALLRYHTVGALCLGFSPSRTQTAMTFVCLPPTEYIMNQDVGTFCNPNVYNSSTAKCRNHQYHPLRSQTRFKCQAPAMGGSWVQTLPVVRLRDPGAFAKGPRRAAALL